MQSEADGAIDRGLLPSERGLDVIWSVLAAVRWIAAGWLVYAVTAGDRTRWAVSGILAVAVVVWTLIIARSRPPGPARVAVDVGVGVLACVTLGIGDSLSDTHLLAPAVVYSLAAVLSAGAALGPIPGGGAGLLIATCLFAVRLAGGSESGFSLWSMLALDGAILVAAGLLAGLITGLLRRLSRATEQAILESRKAARLAERESMARQLHDSVLQVLTLIHKRGMELAESPDPSPRDIASLAEMARDEQESLRRLFLRKEPEAPAGEASLRNALEVAVAGVQGVTLEVSAVGPVWMPRGVLSELVAAASEAVANVVKHSGATRATIFADEVNGVVQVTVRDNGAGFEFDEDALRRSGKFGVLNSMQGRVRAIGGQMTIESVIGRGTEVDFRVPVRSPTALEPAK